MSSSHRNPKELKDIIEKSKSSEWVEVEHSMQNLRNLTEDDKTEIGFLRARVEEQSRLIMILKQRGDEYILRNKALETLTREFSEEKDALENEIKELDRKCELTNKRFMDLAENHEEMIKIKDEYKATNLILVEENRKYKAELNHYKTNEHGKDRIYLEKIEILNGVCKDYEAQVAELSDRLVRQKSDYETLIESNEESALTKINHLELQISDYEKKEKEMRTLLAKYEEELQNSSINTEKKLKELKKRKR